MYKLLLVEDEDIIRKGLLAKIQHHNLDISTYYEAADSMDARIILQNLVPDIVVTDIKLLTMDGLSLVEEICAAHPDVQFIVISGHSEFSYAKRAIALGVVSYLLKPVGMAELGDALRKCIARISAKRISAKEQQHLEERNLELESVQRANRLLFSRTEPSPEELCSLNPFPDAKGFALAAVSLPEAEVKRQAKAGFCPKDLELLRFALLNITDDLSFGDKYLSFHHMQNNTQILLLFSHRGEENYGEIQSYCRELLDVVQQAIHIRVNIFLSSIHRKISPALIDEVCDAAESKSLDDCGVLKVFKPNRTEQSINTQALKHLKSCIINNYASQIPEIVEQFFVFPQPCKLTAAYYRLLFIKIADLIAEIQTDLSTKTSSENDLRMAAKEIVQRFSSEKAARDFLCQCIMDIFNDSHLELNNVRNVHRIRLAQQYIERNYDKQLTVNDLAEQFHLNHNYFSTLFKKETGQTVINYLTAIRMREACRLLSNTTTSASDISKMIGYENLNYFYKIFKKYMGLTPVSYREQKGNSN